MQDFYMYQNQNQKSFNVPQMGKFVCPSSDRILQEQKPIAKINNIIKKGRNRIDVDTYLYDMVHN